MKCLFIKLISYEKCDHLSEFSIKSWIAISQVFNHFQQEWERYPAVAHFRFSRRQRAVNAGPVQDFPKLFLHLVGLLTLSLSVPYTSALLFFLFLWFQLRPTRHWLYTLRSSAPLASNCVWRLAQLGFHIQITRRGCNVVGVFELGWVGV